MNILSHVHAYPPIHNCGAEWMLHEINKYFVSMGHSVRVALKGKNAKSYIIDGVEVIQLPSSPELVFNWADVVFTHLECTYLTQFYARRQKTPVFWIAHNTFPYTVIQQNPEINIVYNCQGTKDLTEYKPNNYYILNPPVDYRNYDVCSSPENNEYITLINLNENKGGAIFTEIAKRMPDKKFIGVLGGYEEQIYEDLPNLTIVQHTNNIQKIYQITRILLMPSRYESWGRTATEAMSSGIPVIANKTFGLAENLGDAGIWVERDNIEQWVAAIKHLDKKKAYKIASNKARARSRELDPQEKLLNFAKWLHQII